MPDFEFLDHTGELAVKIKGKDLPSLFINAVKAMTDYLSPDLKIESEGKREQLQVSALDQNSLLVAWLSEILYRISVNHQIYNKFQILNFNPNFLSAEIIGYPVKKLSHEIKAVTHHNLQIRKTEDHFEVIITFDI